MIINTHIPKLTKDEPTTSGFAVVTSVNNRRINLFITQDVPEYAFYSKNQTYADYLKSVEFTDDVKTINASAFYNQAAMQIEDFNKVEYIGSETFTNCKALTIPIMDNVKTIASKAFVNCSSLSELNLPSIEHIEGIGSATSTFSGCSMLEKVYLGENIKRLGSGNVRVFQANGSLTTINLPASLEEIATGAFYSCPNLTDITVGVGFNLSLNLGDCGILSQKTLEEIVENYAPNSGKKLTLRSETYDTATTAVFTGSELTIAEYASAKGLTLASS